MSEGAKVLILTAGYGDGHMQVANAVKDALIRRGCGEVRIMDLYREAHPGLSAVTRYIYLHSPMFSAAGIDYYGWSYYSTRNMNTRGAMASWLASLGKKRLEAAVAAFRPDAVISAFPFGNVAASVRRLGIAARTFTVMTDFSLHNRWLLSNPDRYYVATRDLKLEMERQGVPGGQIVVSGIPVREAFDRRVAREDSGDRRTVLMLAGAYGVLQDLRKMAERLLSIPSVKLDIVCGRNDKLRRELERHFAGAARVRISGFVDALHERMRSAACIVTKAGGITLAEAMLTGTPLLVFKPFPGQERENARYLENKGAARIAGDMDELAALTRELLTSGAMRAQMTERQRSIAARYAADTIADDMLRLVHGQAALRA